MFDFFNLKEKAFGLDISDKSLKIINLKQADSRLYLDSYGEKKILQGVVEGGIVKNEEALIKSIKEACSEAKGNKLGTKMVIASLPEEKAFLQVIQMPKINDEDLATAVRYEAVNYIPMPIDQMCLDFKIVKPLSDHLDHVDILLVAFPKDVVQSYVNAIKGAGLTPLALEIESQAIARAIIKNDVSPTPVFIIELGATRTSFIIYSGHSVRFTSSIPFSSGQFTEAIARKINVDIDRAEQLKTEYGLSDWGGEYGKLVFESLVPGLCELVDQVKSHIRYYQTHSDHEHLLTGGQGISKIILCGGGANLKGLTEHLSQQLLISVEIGNPWVNILKDNPEEIPALAYNESLSYIAALGLALRGVKLHSNIV
ncbi:MAG: type IV pilus assembly protein PilM [bacterium]